MLEGQYYRLVLNAPWGDKHLKGHRGNFWVGAGCRDVSNVIPAEFVQVHAAILARQVRLATALPDAAIRIWRSNPETGTVDTTAFGVTAAISVDLGETRIVWDEGLRAKVREMRERGLPAETGGVLLGYFDLKANRAYIVDALPAPPDSIRTASEFARGIEGLESAIKDASERTAGIVGYVGEWHSHPRNVSAAHSGLDIMLLVHLATMLRHDGLPALMLIAGEDGEEWMFANVGS
jgi:integrative and conjugative element protein (TIGR02256 family)